MIVEISRVLRLTNRLQLPGPAILPAAGAVVGIYSGLLAGMFSNLIALVDGLSRLAFAAEARPEPLSHTLFSAFTHNNWHLEFIALAGLPALIGLEFSRRMPAALVPELVRRRLRVLSILVLGALALYYPVLGLTVVNHVFHAAHSATGEGLHYPWWAMLVLPTLGGAVVGRLLRDRPDVHGHGIPEVQRAIAADGEGIGSRGGFLKVVASAVTIGTGGSAGREGPIVYGGAAFASGVGRTLGFSRRELIILLASGAGAGIAASFNAPIAGTLFAFEILLREFELKVISPIILASVAATLVGRELMGAAPLLQRFPYQMISGWEVISYLLLGLLCGVIAFAFIRMLHKTEDVFAGRAGPSWLKFLSAWSPSAKTATGGFLVGAMALLNPTVWSTGHHFTNIAASGELSIGFLALACVLKMTATAITLGSGGSGGTFFPATVMGAMAGGAFGHALHTVLPAITAPSGAYALVGMGAAVAGLTRGPLTGMMMIYELTGNYQIILPLMVACTIASALCHHLVERAAVVGPSPHELLSQTEVRSLMTAVAAIPANRPIRAAVDVIVASGETAAPALNKDGHLCGLVQLNDLHAVWSDAPLVETLVVEDIVHRVTVLRGSEDLHSALSAMNREDIDVLPVLEDRPHLTAMGIITRAAIRRFLRSMAQAEHKAGVHPVAPTEVDAVH